MGKQAFINKNLPGTKHKSLCLIPERFAIAMTERGWILRNTIIWHKPSCMPSSIKDRFTVDFEKLFFFTKSQKYFFNQQFEPHKHGGVPGRVYPGEKREKPRNQKWNPNKNGRNKRAVWSIAPQPLPIDHFATYPEKLVEIPIKAGCPKGGVVLDPFMGSGTSALVALKNNRKFIGIELNPKYVEIAMERIRPELDQLRLFAFSDKNHFYKGSISPQSQFFGK
jgi:site-specific DNA-methyltransferase (adenine-specific)